MNNFFKTIVIILLAGVAGCAPEGGGGEGSPVTPAVESGSEAELAEEAEVAPPVLPPVKDTQVGLLGAVVDIPFAHRQLYDRMRPGANDVNERQVGLFADATDYKALAHELESALNGAGFESSSRENRDEWVWITVRNSTGQGRIVVRPDGKKPGTVVVFKLPAD